MSEFIEKFLRSYMKDKILIFWTVSINNLHLAGAQITIQQFACFLKGTRREVVTFLWKIISNNFLKTMDF